jgi:ketopantoate hydroxymethyltransferase
VTAGRLPRFVRQYASTAESLLAAATEYVTDVAARRYPDQAHSYA